MGLDMYLARRNYVKNWAHDKDTPKYSVIVKRNGMKSDIDSDKVSYVIEDIAYWRKANAIHKWFVDNAQNGVDDCKEYYVSAEQLQQLVDICKRVLASTKMIEGDVINGYTYKDGQEQPIIEKGLRMEDPSLAKELLPTSEGFFFGSYDYDEGYHADLVDTVNQLEYALKTRGERAEYYYQSSW